MKKITSLILALVMAMSLTVTALAATTSPVVISDLSNEDVTSIQIPAKYENDVKDTDIDATYYVYMDWSVTSTLKYVVDKNSYSWTVYSDAGGTTKIEDATANTKPESAKYNVKGHWDDSAEAKATITVNVENWSNKDVKVAYKLDGATKSGNVTENFEFQNLALPAEAKTLTTAAKVATADTLVLAKDIATDKLDLVITAANIKTGAINADGTVIGTLTVTITAA